ncbi:MAG TPA: preprotein translocase subunit SecD, partial [Methanocorpusculum sp.]|nr:preprotein translocase subunit SecD [Methanocorpusculum sp.]
NNIKYEKGITKETADDVKNKMDHKINSMGTKDVKINLISPTGHKTVQYIHIEMAGADIKKVQEAIGKQGIFEIKVAKNITANEFVPAVNGTDITTDGLIRQDPGTKSYNVPLKLSNEGAEKLREACLKAGALDDPYNHQLYMYLDGELIDNRPLAHELAANMKNGPSYNLIATNGGDSSGKYKANQLRMHIQCGALPIPVTDAAQGETSATQGGYFKIICIIAALAALAAVAFMVYIRYRIASIVIPMIATNIAEITILLGIAVIMKQQLDLAAIAALIAVLGTGIDQLIIITDEIVHEGVVPSPTLYLNRLKRALIIIITSAATVVIAMFPLIMMDLSSLKGFAIVSILGVLIGVIITRPAYGKIVMDILSK